MSLILSDEYFCTRFVELKNIKMTEASLWKHFEGSESNLDGYTLIIPSVAVGNVGQLSCDLLISSLNMKKIASIYSPAVIPVIGYDPYDLNSISLSGSCEVYKAESPKLVIVQIRAPLVYKSAKMFLENIVDHFEARNIRNIVILTSSFAHEKKHIMTSPFRYISNNNGNVYHSDVKSADLIEHDVQNGDIKIYGGGFACLLYKICDEKSLPCLILFKYCSEGDNIPDAHDMVKCLNNVHVIFDNKQELSTQLIHPISWKLLFGGPPPSEIY